MRTPSCGTDTVFRKPKYQTLGALRLTLSHYYATPYISAFKCLTTDRKVLQQVFLHVKHSVTHCDISVFLNEPFLVCLYMMCFVSLITIRE